MTAEDPHSWLEPDARDGAGGPAAPGADSGAAGGSPATPGPSSPDGAAPRAARLCARVSCSESAVATLTADYGDRVMAVGPLSPERTPPALDLCARHRASLTPPDGWALLRHDPSR